MIVSIHQPSYFPWLGLLSKIAKSNIFILLDEVQLSDRAYQHRNIFLNTNGEIKYLTIPINKKGYRNKNIRELTISSNEWQKNHKLFIEYNYKKSPFYTEVVDSINFIFEKHYLYLIDVLIDCMLISLKLFNINTKLVLQSSLDYDKDLKKSDLILALIKSIGANIYLSGNGAKEYLNIADFKGNKIRIEFLEFIHPEYTQINSKVFQFGMANLDFLFSQGIENSKKVLFQ